jgi:voltage-gated potassium channel
MFCPVRVRARPSKGIPPAPEREAGLDAGCANLASMWKQDPSGRVETPFEPLILAATLAMIPVLILERDAKSHTWKTVAQAANWVIWAVFATEIAVVLVVAQRKKAALRAHWLDAAITVLTVPAYGRLLSSLRLVRLVRLGRLLRVVAVVGRALQAERRLTSRNTFRFVAVATLFLVFIAGAAEATVDRGDFRSFWDGIWWAVVTVTTVGYGDLYPKTVGGRAIAMLLMVFGIGFIAVLTASIASIFVKTERQDETNEIVQTLRRIETDLAELKARLGS